MKDTDFSVEILLNNAFTGDKSQLTFWIYFCWNNQVTYFRVIIFGNRFDVFFF